MHVREQVIFGPRTTQPEFQGDFLQQGQGWGSFFGKIGKSLGKFGKLAGKGIKKIATSDVMKEAGNALLEHGVNATTEIIANAIDPSKNSDPLTEAKNRLDAARSDISGIIRKKRNYRNDDEDKEEEEEVIKKKKKQVKYKKKKQKKQNKKKYNIFEDV